MMQTNKLTDLLRQRTIQLFAGLMFAGLITGSAQTKKETNGPAGYLTRSAPPLRFAPPPKPSVKNLPPTGIADRSSVVFTKQFKTGPDLVLPQSDTAPSPPQAKPSTISPQPPDASQISYTNLVKYFEKSIPLSTNKASMGEIRFTPPSKDDLVPATKSETP